MDSVNKIYLKGKLIKTEIYSGEKKIEVIFYDSDSNILEISKYQYD